MPELGSTHIGKLLAERPSLQRGVADCDGIAIPYVVDGTGEPPRLISGHGGTGIGTDTRFVMAPVVDRGWTLVSFDHRGHGGASPVTDPARLTPEAFGEDYFAVMDDLGWDRCWIGGGSMGAATSMAAAMTHPERVIGLVQMVVAVTEDGTSAEAKAFLNEVADAAEAGRNDLLSYFRNQMLGAPDAPDPQGDALIGFEYRMAGLAQHDPASVVAVARALAGWKVAGVPSRLHELDFPIVVIGVGDPIHPEWMSKAVADGARDSVYKSAKGVDGGPPTLGQTLADALDEITRDRPELLR